MRFPLLFSGLLLLLAPALVAQSSDADSLGDVARQTRAHAGSAKRVYDNQNSDFGRSAEDGETPCGGPITGIPAGYVSSTLGQTITDDQLAKALLRWLAKHPDLDLLHPADVARLTFPHTAAQAKANQEAAIAEASQWMRQVSAPVAPNDADGVQSTDIAPVVPSASGSASTKAVLAKAVALEEQRRVRSDGSEADRLAEAANLYSICESRRQEQFQEEIDKVAKEYLQKGLVSNTETASGSGTETPKGE